MDYETSCFCDSRDPARNPFILFYNLPRQEFQLRFESDSDSNIAKLKKLDYLERVETLIVEMLSSPHEQAGSLFDQLLFHKLTQMHVNTRRDLRTQRDANVKASDRNKQPGASYSPAATDFPGRDDWPTVVVEVGLSESRQKVEESVKWWLTASEGRVRTAIAIDIAMRQAQRLVVDKWEMPSDIATPVRSSSVTLFREQDGNIGMQGDAELVIQFQRLFLRNPAPGQGDIVFTRDDLEELADCTWTAFGSRVHSRPPPGLYVP